MKTLTKISGIFTYLSQRESDEHRALKSRLFHSTSLNRHLGFKALAASFQISNEQIETKPSSPTALVRSQTVVAGQNRPSKMTSDSAFMKSLLEMAKSDELEEPGARVRDVEVRSDSFR